MTLYSYNVPACLAIFFFILPGILSANENRPPDSFFEREDPGLNVYNGEIPAGNRIYVAPDGDNDNDGTEQAPLADLDYALAQVSSGDVIVMRGGIYEHDDRIDIEGPDGTEDQRIVVTAYPGEVPVLDFFDQPDEGNYHGIYLTASYWHIIGITIRYASHNGLRNDGSHNILEQLTAYGNHDSGLHMAGNASFNLLKNSDSFHNYNYDPDRTPRIGNNADGITIKFGDIGPGNHIYGCRAWENSDDGYDFWTAPNEITLENSWAINNGDPSVFGDPPDFEGGANGFKLGGDGVPGNHIVKGNMAIDHASNGFDHNNNTGVLTLIHNTSFDNGSNFNLDYGDRIDNRSVFLNNLSVKSNTIANVPTESVVRANSWQESESISEDVFKSVDTELAIGPREEDGSLPDTDFLKPDTGTLPVDGGEDLGEPFYGSAPDMGAIELKEGERVEPEYVLDTPEIIEPLQLESVLTTAATFAWTEVPEADEYEFQLSPYNFYDSSYLEIDELTVNESFEPSSIQHVEHYYRWRVRAKNDDGVSDWSEIPLIITESELEYLEITALTPEDGSTVEPEQPEFTWQSSDIAVEYQFQITESNFSQPENILLDTTLTQITLEFPGDLQASHNYRWRVRAKSDQTTGNWSNSPFFFTTDYTSIAENSSSAVPDEYALKGNYPNPFNPITNINYSIPEEARVEIRVIDMTGRQVRELINEVKSPGFHEVEFHSEGLASGVYLYQMQAYPVNGSGQRVFTETGKMSLIK